MKIEGFKKMNEKSEKNTVITIPTSQGNSFELSESIIIKLVECGGFVASILVLCLFFTVLTKFVEKVRED